MATSGASTPTSTLDRAGDRIGLWFGSLLLSVAIFSLFFSLAFYSPFFLVFCVTMMFALPAWCLYLPFVIAFKNAEGWRMWIILVSGILIGPASIALWCLIQLKAGGDPYKIWHGEPPINMGGIVCMDLSLIVGFLTTSFYVIALKTLLKTAAAAQVGSAADRSTVS